MANRGLTIIGIPNHSAQPYGMFSVPAGAPTPADLGPEWLKTDEPHETARITSLDPTYSQWLFDADTLPLTINGIAGVNHNFKDGTQYRLIGSRLAAVAGIVWEKKAPNSLTNMGNATGGVGNIDEAIASPDGLYVGPTLTTSPWSVDLGFSAFSPAPRVGATEEAQYAAIVIRAKRTYSGGGEADPTKSPYLMVSLQESGVIVRNLGIRAIQDTSTNGQILIFPFDFSELIDSSGANLEINIYGGQGFSTVGHSYCQVEAVSVYYENQTVSADFAYDSGWVTIDNQDRKGVTGLDRPVKNFHYLPTIPWTTVNNVVLMIRGDQTIHDPLLGTSNRIPESGLTEVDSYYELGCLVIGEGLTLDTGQLYEGPGPASTVASTSLGDTSISGRTYAVDLFRAREASDIEIVVTRSELNTLQEELLYRRGSAGPVYLAMNPDIPTIYQEFVSFWAVVVDHSRPEHIGGGSLPNAYKMTLSFQEKL